MIITPPIQIFPANNHSDKVHRWAWCYLHGKSENVFNNNAFNNTNVAPDLFTANVPKPTKAGTYPCLINCLHAVAVILEFNGQLAGRIALVSDTKGLKEALNINNWF